MPLGNYKESEEDNGWVRKDSDLAAFPYQAPGQNETTCLVMYQNIAGVTHVYSKMVTIDTSLDVPTFTYSKGDWVHPSGPDELSPMGGTALYTPPSWFFDGEPPGNMYRNDTDVTVPRRIYYQAKNNSVMEGILYYDANQNYTSDRKHSCKFKCVILQIQKTFILTESPL